jgi:hypothetical protein
MRPIAICTLSVLLSVLAASDIPETPAMEPVKQGMILLKAGSDKVTPADKTLVVVNAAITAHTGDEYTTQQADDIIAGHKDFGQWETSLRFGLPPSHPAGAFSFWARWKQGGDPEVCIQKYEILAGSKVDALTSRGTFNLKPAGWEYAWVPGGIVNLKADDSIIEVKISGSGHDAKVFNAFLLGGAAKP